MTVNAFFHILKFINQLLLRIIRKLYQYDFDKVDAGKNGKNMHDYINDVYHNKAMISNTGAIEIKNTYYLNYLAVNDVLILGLACENPGGDTWN